MRLAEDVKLTVHRAIAVTPRLGPADRGDLWVGGLNVGFVVRHFLYRPHQGWYPGGSVGTGGMGHPGGTGCSRHLRRPGYLTCLVCVGGLGGPGARG